MAAIWAEMPERPWPDKKHAPLAGVSGLGEPSDDGSVGPSQYLVRARAGRPGELLSQPGGDSVRVVGGADA